MCKGTTVDGFEVDDVFPHQVCINLDRRPERWEESQHEFARHQMKLVRRFPALDGKELSAPSDWAYTTGAYGCLISHMAAVRDAQERKLPNLLIFEDDVALAPDFQEKFGCYIAQLPTDWDMLYFGALHDALPIPVSKHVHRISRADSTFAYALNHTIFDRFIATNSAARLPVDRNNRLLQKEFNCYCFVPHLAWVRPVYSDAQERFSNHWYLRESLVLPGRGSILLVADSLLVIAYGNPTRDHRVAEHLLRMVGIYSTHLQGLVIAIVEQGLESTIDQQKLPDHCTYRFVESDAIFNSAKCFNAAVSECGISQDVLIFMDGTLFLETRDLAGNIAMCHKYDCTTGYDRVFDLTDCDIDNLLHDDQLKFRWFKPETYPVERKAGSFRGCCFFNRRAFQAAGGWCESDPPRLTLRTQVVNGRQFTVFESPNHALRLCQRLSSPCD
jgi:GR25 family glycosyltransferase involved in LPS biosynthesis